MAGFSRWVRPWRVGVAAGFAVVAAAAVLTAGGDAGAATANLAPICNDLNFYVAPLGKPVTIPVGHFAADPDLDPIRLVSVSNDAPNLGTVAISNTGASRPGTAALKFTLTSSTPGTVTLYWTVSGGSLQASCEAFFSDVPPPPNG